MMFQLMFSAAIMFMGAELLKRGMLKHARGGPLSAIVILPLCLISPVWTLALQASTGASPNITLGATVGASLFALLAIPGLVVLMRNASVSVLTPQEKLAPAISAALLWLLSADGVLTKADQWVLFAAYVGYAIAIRDTTKRIPDTETLPESRCTRWGAIAYDLVGCALLITGGNLLIDGTLSTALARGMSEGAAAIGILGVAASTSLWLASIQAAGSGNMQPVRLLLRAQPALLLLAPSIATAFTPIPMEAMMQQKALPLLFAAHLLALGLLWRIPTLTKLHGLLLLALWAGCVITLSI